MTTVFQNIALMVLTTFMFWGVAECNRNSGRTKPVSDEAVISFDSATYKVKEQDGAVNIRIKREGNIESAVSFGLMTLDVTAQDGSDYRGFEQELRFKRGEVSKNVNVEIVGDDVFEANKFFEVILYLRTRRICLGQVCLGQNSATEVTIVDDDDRDECSDGTDPCGDKAVCTNTPGLFLCSCSAGFTGNPMISCTDIDECAASGCGDNADCTNTEGSFTCACQYGFNGNPNVGCIDMCNLSPCGENAECKVIMNRPICSCPAGYTGDPFVKCTVFDICNPTPCGVNALCEVRDDRPQCSCPPGYTGNPLVSCSGLI